MDLSKIDFNKFFQSRIFKAILCGIGALTILLIVFGAGVFVGAKKADFSCKWGENYHRNFAGPRGGFFNSFRNFPGKDLISGHGVFGQILKIDGTTLVIKEQNDNMEKIVLVKNNTVIERFRQTIKITDLKIDDQIIVIGAPNNNGQIEAKLIRIMPASPSQDGPSPLPPPAQ